MTNWRERRETFIGAIVLGAGFAIGVLIILGVCIGVAAFGDLVRGG